MKSCIVVGAGISGLTAALRLQQAGYDVIVLESAEQVGGRVISVEWSGFTLNPGAQFVTSADGRLLQLMSQLGVQDILTSYGNGRGLIQNVLRDGRIHTYNYLSLPDFFRWSGVSLRSKLGLLKLLPVFLKYRNADTHHPYLAPGIDELNLQEFFEQRVNRELLEYYIEPTLATYCSWEPADVSLKMFGIVMAAYLNQKLFTIEGGVGRFTTALAHSLHVELRTQVNRVIVRNGGVTVECVQDGVARRFDADVAVIATPGDTVLSLLADAPDAWRAFYPQVSYSSAVVIFRAIRLGDAPLPHDLTLPRVENKLTSFVWFVDRQGDVALTLSELKPHLHAIDWSDADLLGRSRAEFIQFYPDLRNQIEGERLFRWRQKVPNFRVGYLDALRVFREQLQPGPIYPCGDYLAGPSTGAALSSGWQCAEAIAGA
ncbi:MAG TPA: FAD-dependent oxidoreductase [Anaerolineae bacterium]|nr:FAD-dependent oxidoreductase [Anaerolineae bacterium]